VAVTKLVKAGFVVRAPDANDRRKVRIHLTPEGAGLAPLLLPLAAEVNALATAGLAAEEIEGLRRALNKICENISR
jgi:DNA-binding MarR family transcriptional regulator